MKFKYTYLSLIVVLFISFSVLSCARTEQKSKTPQESGFLETYEGFKPDEEGRFNLVYINESADFSKYNKFFVQTVTAYVPESKIEKMNTKELQELVNYINDTIVKDFSKNWELASRPGPDTFAIRFAFTQLGKGDRIGDTITTYAPPARAFTELKKLATGKHAFVGEIAHEAEVIDSVTSERLAATLGVRAGGKTFKNTTDKLRDAKAAVDIWVQNANEGLLELKQESMSKQ